MTRTLFVAGISAAALLVFSSAHAVTFGILGDSSVEAQTVVTNVGYSASILGDLTAGDLTGLDVLWLLNSDNVGQLVQLTSNLPAIDAFVTGGGVLLYHDRDVTRAATAVPGAGSISFTRNLRSSIDVLATMTLVAEGPGGVIGNTTLDGCDASNHGYMAASSLPVGAVPVFSRTVPNQIVDAFFGHGFGFVYYSSIPLDFFLVGKGPVLASANFRGVYATNVVACVASLSARVECLEAVPAREPSVVALAGAGVLTLAYFTRQRRR
jgi:hypothetical protein